MSTFGVVWVVVMSLFFAVCGWFCLFRTELMVRRAQKNCTNGTLFRSYPYSKMVFKPWYPMLIRCMGIFIWSWAAAIDFLIVTKRFH
jgi:hypothetical protein